MYLGCGGCCWGKSRPESGRRSGLPFPELIQKCIEALGQINERQILTGMGDLLDEKKKVWVKANLLRETIFLLKARLASDVN